MATRKMIRDADDLVALANRMREAGVLEFEVEGVRVVLRHATAVAPTPTWTPEPSAAKPDAKSYYDRLFPAGKPEFPNTARI
jgi:hypothetical protein